MDVRQIAVRVGLPIVLVGVLAAVIYPRLGAQNAPEWMNQDDNWTATKQTLQDFGDRFATSEEMYEALRQSAGANAKSPSWQQMSEAAFDWSGIYTRTKGALHF